MEVPPEWIINQKQIDIINVYKYTIIISINLNYLWIYVHSYRLGLAKPHALCIWISTKHSATSTPKQKMLCSMYIEYTTTYYIRSYSYIVQRTSLIGKTLTNINEAYIKILMN